MTDKNRTREQCEEKHCESRFGSWVYDMYHDWPFTVEDCIGYNGDNTVIEELREMCDDLVGRDLWDRTVIKTEKGYDWDYSSWFKKELGKGMKEDIQEMRNGRERGEEKEADNPNIHWEGYEE